MVQVMVLLVEVKSLFCYNYTFLSFTPGSFCVWLHFLWMAYIPDLRGVRLASNYTILLFVLQLLCIVLQYYYVYCISPVYCIVLCVRYCK